MYRLGIDIGGTFTDALLLDEAGGPVMAAKVPSTPADPSQAFLTAAERILRDSGVSAEQIRLVVHGTTVATNTIIEGKGAQIGFLTTDGFRDMLEIARQIRPSLYDLRFVKPPPLVPRERCYGIPERLDFRGEVLTALDEDAVRAAGRALQQAGVAAVAVCFLHSYRNPAHERRAGEILRESCPGLQVCLSCDVAPEFREYLRASTTVVNATVQPIAAAYLQGIERRLRAVGFAAELLVMQSSGGVFSFAAGAERPVFLIESGPAAGVIAAAHIGARVGRRDLIAFDMGGTTAKASLVLDGRPRVTKDFEVGAQAQAGSSRSRGSGYPIRTPVIDLVEIGAGGGSIAWIDDGGGLRVGPRSAGAEPGPVCYRRGGTLPTVTDANLVLGRLSPDNFLGGELLLDPQAAAAAIAEQIARPLGLSLQAAAHAIVEIANSAMTAALRLVTVQRGHDPRGMAMVAFGGAGPLHADRLAQEIGVAELLIPPSPGTTSALGLLAGDLRHDEAQTLLAPLAEVSAERLTAAFAPLLSSGRLTLTAEGLRGDEMAFERALDLRYRGQSHELTVMLPETGELTESLLANVPAAFHRAHHAAYGTSAPHEAVELVSVRVCSIGRIARPLAAQLAQQPGAATAAIRTRRPVYFAEAGGEVDTAIYARARLRAGMTFRGPAVVEEFDATTVIQPGRLVSVDDSGNLRVATAETEAD